MEAAELRTLAEVEDRHWWYKERRSLLARELRRLGTPGIALDIGAAGGGNTRVLRAHGWRPLALEYAPTAAQIARERGIDVIRGDARELPMRTGSLDLVTAFDVLEHIEEDYLVAAEITRVLRPGGTALIAVPADMALWSAHDEAVNHVRRYDKDGLTQVITKGGLVIEDCEGPRFKRITHIRKLLADGRLDSQLRWTSTGPAPVSMASAVETGASLAGSGGCDL